MKKGKKILLLIVGLFICLFLLAIIYVDTKKDEIVPYFVNTVNSKIEGEITYEDISLIPFKHFPDVSISINKPLLQLANTEGVDSVIFLDEIDLSFNILQLFKSEINVNKLSIYGGYIGIRQNPDSTFNISNALKNKNITVDSSAASKMMDLNVDNLVIENLGFDFKHLNHNTHINTTINDVKASFSYQKDSLKCALNLRSTINKLETNEKNIIDGKELNTDGSFFYNFNTETIRIDDVNLGIAEALIKLTGEVELINEENIHLKFEADDKDLQFTKLFFAEVNNEFIESGNIFLNGSIEGSLNDELPLTKLSFGAERLTINIPGTDNKIQNLDFDAEFISGTKKNLQEAKLSIDSIKSELPDGHLNGYFSMVDFTKPYLNYNLDLETTLNGFDNLLKGSALDSLSGHIRLKNKFIGYLIVTDSISVDSVSIIEAELNDVSFSIVDEFIFKNINSTISSEGEFLELDSTSLSLNRSFIKLNGTIDNFLALIFELDKPAVADLSLTTDLYDFPEFFSYSPNIGSSFPYKIENAKMDVKVTTSIKQLSHFSKVPKMDFDFDYLSGNIKELCSPIEINKGVFNMADIGESATFDFKDFSFTLGGNPISLQLFYSFSDSKNDSLDVSAKLQSFDVGKNVYLKSFAFLNDSSKIIIDKNFHTQLSWGADSTVAISEAIVYTDDFRYITDTVIFSCEKASIIALNLKNINEGAFPLSTLDGNIEFDFKKIYSPVYIDKNIGYTINVDNGRFMMKSKYKDVAFKDMDLEVDARPFDSIPKFAVKYDLNDVPINTLFPISAEETIIDGGVDFKLNIHFEGLNEKSIFSTIGGSILLDGDSLALKGIDVDKLIDKFKKSQNFNLVDIGAVMIAGPVGIVFSKGSNYASLLVGNKSDSSIINQVTSEWEVDKGNFEIKDFALATDENRIAIQGWVNLKTDSLDLDIALINDRGCSIVNQSLKGELDKPKAGNVKFVKTILAPVTNLVNDVLGVDCDVFYDGVVKAPNVKKDKK